MESLKRSWGTRNILSSGVNANNMTIETLLK